MKQKLNIDHVFSHIGEMGPQQIRYLVLMSVMTMYSPQFMIQYNFVGRDDINFTCHLKNGSSLANYCLDGKLSSCNRIDFQTDDADSIISEWSLICDQTWLSPLSTSLFFAGVMMGSLILGSVADRIGRKKTFVFTFLMMLIFNGIASAVSSYRAYLALKFICGFFKAGYILASFVLISELIGASKRGLVGTVLSSAFAFGIVIFSIIAYYVNFWRYLTATITFIGIPLFLLACLLLPESPRWLLNMGNRKETLEVLKLIANGNQSKWDHSVFVNAESDDSDSDDDITIQPHLPSSQRLDSIMDLFKDKYMLKLTLIQIYSWFVNGCAYYGITLAAGHQGHQNLYWGTAMSGFVEMPAYVVILFSLEYFKRTTNMSAFMIFGGVSMIVIPMLQSSMPMMASTLAAIGKLGISSSFAIIYIHSNELFPTSIRNSGMGLVAVASRIGGILAPYVVCLKDVIPNLHFIIFGLMGLTSGLCTLYLPDTKDLPLPGTIQDLLSRRVHVVSVQSPHTTYKKIPQTL